MENHNSASESTTSSSSRRTSSYHSANTRSTKTKFARRIKKLIFCGVIQAESASPLFESALPIESTRNLTTSMAVGGPNENQWHTVNDATFQFTVPVRYQNLTLIGQGAFGVVCRATDTELERPVAIKKMLRPFESATHAQRTYRELKLLTYLNHPDAQVVQLYNVFTPEKNLNDFQTLYFVFNYAGGDLFKCIGRRQPFLENTVKLIIYSILRGLKFMHSAGVIHRDLKPQNIGLDPDTDVTILDFGLARVASNGVQTGYVATRWWRAPEIYLNWERYNEKLDIWSVGCMMAELIRLRTVFRGSDHLDQLNKIFDILGTPDVTVLNEICTAETCNYLKRLEQKPKKDFNELFGFKYGADAGTPISGVSPEGVDLLDRLLAFDHRVRPTAEEALAHPFFKTLRDPMDEPTTERMVDEHADATYSIEKWKGIIWQMISDFVPPVWLRDDPDEDE